MSRSHSSSPAAASTSISSVIFDTIAGFPVRTTAAGLAGACGSRYRSKICPASAIFSGSTWLIDHALDLPVWLDDVDRAPVRDVRHRELRQRCEPVGVVQRARKRRGETREENALPACALRDRLRAQALRDIPGDLRRADHHVPAAFRIGDTLSEMCTSAPLLWRRMVS